MSLMTLFSLSYDYRASGEVCQRAGLFQTLPSALLSFESLEMIQF